MGNICDELLNLDKTDTLQMYNDVLDKSNKMYKTSMNTYFNFKNQTNDEKSIKKNLMKH